MSVTFEDIGISDDLLKGVYSCNFNNPSKIQIEGISIITGGNDCLLQSPSGTGKTATYLLGSLNIINPNLKETQAIIISPTKDLAEQIHNVCSGFIKYSKITSALCIGGVDSKKNAAEMKKKPNVIIGTIGRLSHMIRINAIRTNHIKIVVLDEADNILSQGFLEELDVLLAGIKSDYQTCLLSATFPKPVQDIAAKMTKNPKKLLLKKEDISVSSIKQYYIDVEIEDYKLLVLLDLYKNLPTSQTIIYCNKIEAVNWLKDKLEEEGFPIRHIHGDMTTEERAAIVKKFRDGDDRILLTTDLLARGIDIPDISLVINYDLPTNKENYIHRIGRSGRFGRKGIAINFLKSKDERDVRVLDKISSHYGVTISELPADITFE